MEIRNLEIGFERDFSFAPQVPSPPYSHYRNVCCELHAIFSTAADPLQDCNPPQALQLEYCHYSMELAERDTALRWVAACENIAKGAMWLVCNVCGSYLSD